MTSMFAPSTRDWPEDDQKLNRVCPKCSKRYYGLKERSTCYVCADKSNTPWQTPEELQKTIRDVMGKDINRQNGAGPAIYLMDLDEVAKAISEQLWRRMR